MSATAHHHAHLRQLSGDPTNTEALRERFVADVRGRFREVRGAIRGAVGYERDIFDLRADARLADADDVKRFETDRSQRRSFIRTLREWLRAEVLEATTRRAVRNGEHWTATYIRAAYRRGWENAVARLRNEGISVTEADRDIFDLGVPARQLERLYTRTYENLESITTDTAPAVRRVLTRGLAEGVNPREMAGRLTEEVRTLQHTRAEVLARTEVINSYSQATIDRYERAQIDTVTLSGEFATADDRRVCPICESLAGAEFALDALREATTTFEPSESEPDHLAGEYPVRPPVHPRCRCAILPVVG